MPDSPGYSAVLSVAREQRADWLSVIRACHDTIERQVAAGNVEHTCSAWIKGHTGLQVRSLRPLVTWGVLERKRWGVVDGQNLDASGGRAYYLMPDRAGVARGLAKLGA